MNKKEKMLNTAINDENYDDTCDLDPNKICDSCGKCIEITEDYKSIEITKIITDDNKY